jgi:acetyltransferase-like isoleucine patch superfamily enzyme
MSETKIHPGVELGKNVEIGDFVVLGVPYKGMPAGTRTVIGDGAVIRSHTVIYAGNVIGRNFQSGHGVLIRECNVIGDDVSVGSHSVVEHHVTLENGVRIHTQAFVPEFSHLEEEAWVGPNVVFTNALYPRSRNVKNDLRGPRLGRRAKIGANSTLLPGVVIGSDALVGAGSVVVRSVAAGKVAVGNPARVIKDIRELPYDLKEAVDAGPIR